MMSRGGMQLRIGFLNPWRQAAENQAFSSLCIAAARTGNELVYCSNSAEVERCSPDFVLASASTQPKLNDLPHYGVIHEPRDRFLKNRTYFHNLLSYDGYLTISETLDKFIRDVTFGTGREKPVGFYYNTCQRQEISADLGNLAGRRALRITYCGTNWDQRRRPFFQLMSETDGIQIFGPEHCWAHLRGNGYGGPLPFDGVSVQARYAANGIGLCMLSDLHLREDIISNRIFEIASVGAVALCCDIPWIRKHFGDSVYYFNQTLSDHALRRVLLTLREEIYRHPEAAIAKANHAREIFERKFAAEVMLANAVRYHERLMSCRTVARRDAEQKYSPLISVIIRCGSRRIEYVRRAVESIARQSYGRFEVIFVRHHDLDLTPVSSSGYSRIASFRTIECMGGNRSESLWAGLNAVSGEYFSILDDDDWWFSDHFERLFEPFPEGRLNKFMAYSGNIMARPDPVPIDGGGHDDRALHRFGIDCLEVWYAVTRAFTSNCFVASSDLLHARLLVCPRMETAEDSYVILSLLTQVEPRFSYAATSIFDRSLSDQSSFADHPKRDEDELTLELRLLARDRPRFLAVDTWKTLSEHWGTRRRPEVEVPEREPDTRTILRDWEQVAGGYDLKESTLWSKSSFVDPPTGSARVRTTRQPWAYGAALFLQRPSRWSWEYALLVEVLVRKGTVGVGILNLAENDFLFRHPLTANSKPQTVRIMILEMGQAGRLVIQNWETPGKSIVELISLRLMAEHF